MVAALRSITRHTGYQFQRVTTAGEAAITVTGVEDIAGSVIGRGGWRATGLEVTSGYVVVDVAQMSAASPAVRAAVYAHELGHVLVLDHTDGYQQTMYPSVTPDNLAWGAGDVAALSSLPSYEVC